MLAQKTLEENETSKRLIVELIKENEKLKFEKQIFKNKILENENKELQKQIDNDGQKNKTTLLFKIILGIILGIIFTGIYSIINFIFGSFKKMITQ